MTKNIIITISVVIFCIIIASIYFFVSENKNLDIESENYSLEISDENVARIADEIKIVEPINEFENRITKKPFGVYITPENSPVQPEIFRGYHAGVDVEYSDIDEEVPIKSIADGKVILSKFINGYGGFLAISHNINEEKVISLYGHMDPETMASYNEKISLGDVVGYLGDNKSQETDGERKHLHFGIIKGDSVDVRGYVQNKSELDKWYDPQEYLK